MTPEEQFDRVFASAMQDRQALLRFLDGVTAIQARWHPPDGEWSILEGLEHIMLTEEFFRSNLLTILREAEARNTWDNAPANPVKMSAEALRRREQGFVAAPDVLIPRGERDFQTMRQALLAERQATREAVRGYRTRDLSRLLFPHARYGQRNIYDVIEYSGIHDALHCEQMGRVTRSPGYPAPAQTAAAR
jgi:DinB family protein